MAHFDARWQRPDTIQAIFDQISDGVFFYDKNLFLVRVNKSGVQLFGLPAEQLIGQPYWHLFGFAQPPPGQPRRLPTGTVRVRTGTGRECRVIIRTIELHDEAGSLEGVVATVTDITDKPVVVGLDIADGAHSWGEPVNANRRPPTKLHPIVIRNRRVAAVAGALFLILMVVLVGKLVSPATQLSPAAAVEKEKREAAARFNAMTPAQHLERAERALKPGAKSDTIADGLRHLKAIPTQAPEASRAQALEKDLTRAGNLANARDLIDAASNGEVRDGMDKLQRANDVLESLSLQYPNDKEIAQLRHNAQAAAEQLAVRSPQEFAAAEIKLVDFTWEKGGFGTVMMANFTIRNDSPVDVAQLKIRCERYGDSGVVLDENSGMAYSVVRAHSTTRIPNVNMGFLNTDSGSSHTKKTDCEIMSLKLASESQAFNSAR